MADSLTAQYLALIDDIVAQTLKGNVRSKEQVRSQLEDAVEPGTGEIFERAVASRIAETNSDSSLKAGRILRALKTIEGEWQKGQKARQAQSGLTEAAARLEAADSSDRPVVFLGLIDPNQPNPLTRPQLSQLATRLSAIADLAAWSDGIKAGLANYERIEPDLVSWIYEPAGAAVGFGASSEKGPWTLWQKKVEGLPKLLFRSIAQEEEIEAITRTAVDSASWIDLAILLHFMQQGLITWFDKQPYSAKAGRQLSYSTSLIFAAIWGRLSQGFKQMGASSYQALGDGSFQLMLQILRRFAQRDDFPLYGGVFASFSGDYLQDTLDYFSEPLTQVAGTQEKARILTLLGYSRQMLGRMTEAKGFYEEALEIAQKAGDTACETADLCHLARNAALEKDYERAVSTSQRALILARQSGDRTGQANALINLGYAQVLQARADDVGDASVYDTAIGYLKQGLELAVKQGDFQSQSLAYNSLGIGYVMSDRPQEGLDTLIKGSDAIKGSGNVYLQGLYTLYLAEAHYALQHAEEAVFHSALAMYLLHSIGSEDWRQAAGLASILQGRLGDNYGQTLERYRRQLTPIMSMEGYGSLLALIESYRGS